MNAPPFVIEFKATRHNCNRNGGRVLEGYNEVEADNYLAFTLQWLDAATGVLKESGSTINRNARSRPRKTEFVLSEIRFACFNAGTLSECAGSFQKGFRNADGRPRREKVKINIRRIPDDALVAIQGF